MNSGLRVCSFRRVLVVAFLFWSADLCQADETADLLTVIVETQKSNLAAFKSGKCRFRHSLKSAKNESDAREGKWSTDISPASIDCVWYFRGGEHVFRVDIDARELAEQIKNNKVSLTPINIAIKDGYAIDADGIITDAIVHSPQRYLLNTRYHPFNLAMDSCMSRPELEIHEGHVDFASYDLNKDAELDGKKVIRVKAVSKPGASTTEYVWFFDPEQSYLPYVTEYTNQPENRFMGRMFLLDSRQVGDAHFPMHAVYASPMKPKDREPFVRVREMEVLELDLDYVPTDDDLTIRLPKHTQFSDGVDPNTAKSLYRDQSEEFAKISVQDIKPISEKLQALAVERRKEEQAIASHRSNAGAGPKSSGISLWSVVGINALVVVSMIGIAVWRKRKPGKPTGEQVP